MTLFCTLTQSNYIKYGCIIIKMMEFDIKNDLKAKKQLQLKDIFKSKIYICYFNFRTISIYINGP